MPQLVFTCDVECHDPQRSPQWLLGKSGGRLWLEIVAGELERRNITGAFFVDFSGCEQWEVPLRQAVEILVRRRQRIELHIHPANSGWCGAKMLSALGYDDQARLFETAVNNYRRYVAKEPAIFRAGGYGINDITLRILKDYGLQDSSYYTGKPQVQVRPDDYERIGVISHPVTVSHFRGFGKYVKHDLNIMTAGILEQQILENDVMLFMHSFSFNRFQRRTLLERDNPRPIKRFYKILALIDAGKTQPVDLEHFPNTRFITKISRRAMIANAIYITLRNHYGLG